MRFRPPMLRRPPWLPTACVLLASWFVPSAARADDFAFTIEVTSQAGKVRTEHTERKPGSARQAPGGAGRVPIRDNSPRSSRSLDKPPQAAEKPQRPLMTVRRNEPLALHWKGGNTSKSRTFQNVLVHFFVVKEEEAGQKKLPPLDETVLYEGALTMDFKPTASTQGEFTLRLPEAGAYLVRVETIGLLDQHGHEHFTALDLVAE